MQGKCKLQLFTDLASQVACSTLCLLKVSGAAANEVKAV